MNYRKFIWPPKARPGRRLSWAFKRLAGLLIVFGLLSAVITLFFTDRLIFHPLAEVWETPANYGLKYEEIELQSPEGLILKAWDLPAPPGAVSPRTVLLFQGNSGNMAMMSSRLFLLHSLGLRALTVDYPGYGASQGRPSETRVYQAAEALRQWALSHGSRPEDLILYGYSLGGGVASYLAERHPPAALILDSTFTRLSEVPADALPWLAPYFRLALGDAFDSRSRLAEIRCPLLILHSPGDEVVPFALGEELFQAYRNNYKDLAVGRGGHVDFLLNKDLYRAGIQRLLAVSAPAGGQGH
ncbi:MAG: alpha/beta hydrolase [Candidatus Adiutrix sp.]|nr:alpha/beta hydrolase [Candidatus Adiutrix sp.]